jgi:hypothetical protein
MSLEALIGYFSEYNFFKKAKMLNKNEALEHTGHAIGGF